MSRTNPLLYLEIYNKVKEQIIKGEIATGDLLPTEAELMDSYECSRTTIRHVLSLLREDGLVKTVQGRGSVVSKKLPGIFLDTLNFTMQSAGFYITAPFSNLLNVGPSVDIVEASEAIARILQIQPHSKIYLVISIMSLDGETIFDYRETYVNPAYAPGLNAPRLMNKNICQVLHERYHVHNIRTEDRITPMVPDAETRKILLVSETVPIFLTKRTILCNEGPIAYSIIRTRGDVSEFSINRSILEDG